MNNDNVNKDSVLGIDIGSVSISLALLNAQKEIIKTDYTFHEGLIANKLTSMLSQFNLQSIKGIAVTSATPSVLTNNIVYDSRVSYITAAKKLNDEIGSLLIVGGEKFGLVLFDENQKYKNFKSNTSCAAGTGSFLDQQVKRLNLGGIKEFTKLACNNKGEYPKIASRCSVFAKTDLIHAQQEGYTLSEICDGLCYGLAKNIVDTLFNIDKINQPLIFAGGVSQNKAVANHIEKLSGFKPIANKFSHFYGSIGAALKLIEDESIHKALTINSVDDILINIKKNKKYFYQPLTLSLSDYPNFNPYRKYNFSSKKVNQTAKVEVDIYRKPDRNEYKVYLGIDIGSTSTKAIILDLHKNVLAGFYTKTSGQPVSAVQSIFEAINDYKQNYNIQLTFCGVGTTGSGRKFIGKIVGADIIPDEITAHARAAIELDENVDTIIEIGGQDSKFTTLSNGTVTFSKMNNICAAGTGSFVEEQALKLNVRLEDYSTRAENTKSPLASNRCTVFMERDLNHYINENYETNEILASVLHSIRENYLSKVAIEKNIGEKIFFQGATAKNRALVAAFEQRLKKPIMVSEYCHLTGAMGVALELYDKNAVNTNFRGLDLYKSEIPLRTEICELCTNHCKLKIAEVNKQTEAYGFLCGRDYNGPKYIDDNKSGFNLVKAYKENFKFTPEGSVNSKITIGIPSGLYLFDDIVLWRKFFNLLRINTITSDGYSEAVKIGKFIANAEFCAPMSAMHGHLKYLSDKADYIFLPTYLEEKQKSNKIRRQYCYYSQFTPSIILSIEELYKNGRILNPLLYSLQSDNSFITELYNSIKSIGLNSYTKSDISKAYTSALIEKKTRKKNWQGLYNEMSSKDNNLKVVLLGRPYTILSETMNKNIPDIFAKKGIKTFFQDMLDVNEKDTENIKDLLNSSKWKYATKILIAADKIARTTDLYPVFISSFKCSPDAFVIEYFKQIFDAHKKPYLILQLDEHDSSVGYETRIEAAIRSFENHFEQGNKTITNVVYPGNMLVKNANELKGKTVLMPWLGEYSSRLLEAVLQKKGIDAHTLCDTKDSIKKSMIMNTGQCLPFNIIFQNAIDYIEKHKLDTSNTVLWMLDSPISCNLGMFISYMEKLLRSREEKYHKLKIYPGQITFYDISVDISLGAYLCFMLGGYIRKLECKIRPYEIIKGQTDDIIQKSMDHLYETFLKGNSKQKALRQIIDWFKGIEQKTEKRPKVAIFGDLYARDNDVFNQNLIRCIEKNGGEAITTPYSEYLKIIGLPYNKRLITEGFYLKAAMRRFLLSIALLIEDNYLKYFTEILDESPIKPLRVFEDKLKLFNIKTSHNGESLDNVLKILHLTEVHKDLALIIQTNPAYCCPSLVTEAMTKKMEKISGVPIVTIEYDGTSSFKNEDIIPYLKCN